MTPRLKNIILKYLNEFYGELKPYTSEVVVDTIIFSLNNKIVMELTERCLLVNHNTLWSEVINIFSLNDTSAGEIIMNWVDEKFKYKELPTYYMTLSNVPPSDEWINRPIYSYGYRYEIDISDWYLLNPIDYDTKL